MDKILISTKSLIETEFKNEKFKGGYYDEEEHGPQIIAFNGFNDLNAYRIHLDQLIIHLTLNLQNELGIIGTPVLKLDLLDAIHEILEKRIEEIECFMNSTTAPFPGRPLFSYIDTSKENFYSDIPIEEVNKVLFHNCRVLLKDYYVIQKSALSKLDETVIAAYNEINIKERQAVYNQKEPVRTFHWKGTLEQLNKLYGSANERLFRADRDTFFTVFSLNPERPKMPQKIEWNSKAGRNKQPCKMTLFYFIDYLYSNKLIEKGFSKKERDKTGNRKIFNMIEAFFILPAEKNIENIPESFSSYKKRSPTYNEIKDVIDFILD